MRLHGRKFRFREMIGPNAGRWTYGKVRKTRKMKYHRADGTKGYWKLIVLGFRNTVNADCVEWL